MQIHSSNDIQNIFDNHYTLTCPHCLSKTNITAVSIPRYELVSRFKLKNVGIAYKCDSCKEPIFLQFSINASSITSNPIIVYDQYTEIILPQEDFEFNYLPETVEADFREALVCYSAKCYNAFGAMCRRSIQSAADKIGAEGKDKVQQQIKDMRDMSDLDGDTYDSLKQIIISGHDAAHPHLPTLSPNRAKVLLELMKDVLYQLFVRKAKIAEAVALRQAQVEESKK